MIWDTNGIDSSCTTNLIDGSYITQVFQGVTDFFTRIITILELYNKDTLAKFSYLSNKAFRFYSQPADTYNLIINRNLNYSFTALDDFGSTRYNLYNSFFAKSFSFLQQQQKIFNSFFSQQNDNLTLWSHQTVADKIKVIWTNVTKRQNVFSLFFGSSDAFFYLWLGCTRSSSNIDYIDQQLSLADAVVSKLFQNLTSCTKITNNTLALNCLNKVSDLLCTKIEF